MAPTQESGIAGTVTVEALFPGVSPEAPQGLPIRSIRAPTTD
jgi:hypothetical protein